MKKVTLKNGKEAVLRKSQKGDAQAILDYFNEIGGESEFLPFGTNEYEFTLDEMQSSIEASNKACNILHMLAEIDGEIAGVITASSYNRRERKRHIAELGISIRKKYWAIGLGSELMKALIEWAQNNKVTTKINLVVKEDNYNAIKLYKKFGFVQEGILRNDMCINGSYSNAIIMGRII